MRIFIIAVLVFTAALCANAVIDTTADFLGVLGYGVSIALIVYVMED